MAIVETVRGAVDVDALGPALMHEHVFVLSPEALQHYGHHAGESYWDEEARVADAISKLQFASASSSVFSAAARSIPSKLATRANMTAP